MSNPSNLDQAFHARDADYLATMELMRETLDFLQRLPPHPMTRALTQKIARHLAEPRRATEERLIAASARARERDQQTLFGANYTPGGIPVIQAELFERELRLSSPGLEEEGGDRLAQAVLTRLRGGEVIRLR